SQSHCPERIRVEVAGDTQTMAPLVTPKRLAHLRAERSIAFAAIIALSRESLLRCDNRRVVRVGLIAVAIRIVVRFSLVNTGIVIVLRFIGIAGLIVIHLTMVMRRFV